MVSCIVCIYYSAVAAWAISYFISSFKFALPWATCSNDWNSISKSFNVFFNGLKYFFQNSKHLHDNDISIHLTVLFVVIEITFWFTILFPTTQDMTIPDHTFKIMYFSSFSFFFLFSECSVWNRDSVASCFLQNGTLLRNGSCVIDKEYLSGNLSILEIASFDIDEHVLPSAEYLQ